MARQRLKTRMAAEAAAVLSGSDPEAVNLFGLGAGGGKSEVALKAAIKVVRELRSRGDARNVAYMLSMAA
jgi:hypothetical protein